MLTCIIFMNQNEQQDAELTSERTAASFICFTASLFICSLKLYVHIVNTYCVCKQIF